jgi:hypothetical protein
MAHSPVVDMLYIVLCLETTRDYTDSVLASKDNSPMTEYVLAGDYNQRPSMRISTTLLSSMTSFLLLHIAQPLHLLPHGPINTRVQAHSLESL